jgi:hypothetical protein
MTKRKELLIHLRPEVSYDESLEQTNVVGQFQNEVLRPVLKFQNSVLVAAFIENANRRKVKLEKLSVDELRDFVQSTLTRDQAFKGYLIGMIIGLFTVEEFDFYLQNQRDVNKRIASMLRERLVDQLSK